MSFPNLFAMTLAYHAATFSQRFSARRLLKIILNFEFEGLRQSVFSFNSWIFPILTAFFQRPFEHR